MFEAVTRQIRIKAEPNFLEDRSDAAEGRYFWSYTIEIINEGAEPVQLKSRQWRITDERGHVETVRGPGVVGRTPVIGPGKSFSYTSGCPLTTPSGIMAGQFFMTSASGEAFAVEVPAFSLDSPYCKRSLN